jgi:hypothetical protein
MVKLVTEAIETINRNALVTTALRQGYVAYLPVYDPGIDLILYNTTTRDLKLVQLKGRWTINKKYEGKDIWVAFPDRGIWYVVPHDEVMVAYGERKGYTATPSWEKGEYSIKALTRELLPLLEAYRFGDPKEAEREAEAASK